MSKTKLNEATDKKFFTPIEEQDLKPFNKTSIVTSFLILADETRTESLKKRPRSATKVKETKGFLERCLEGVTELETFRVLIKNYISNIPKEGDEKRDSIIFINNLIDVYNECHSTMLQFLNGSSMRRSFNVEELDIQNKIIDKINKAYALNYPHV